MTTVRAENVANIRRMFRGVAALGGEPAEAAAPPPIEAPRLRRDGDPAA